MKPLPFALGYLGLTIVSLLPAFSARPAAKALATACVVGAMALHAIWMWQAAAVATQVLPPEDAAHRRQRVIASLLIGFIGVLLLGLVARLLTGARLDAPVSNALPYSLSSLIALIAFPAFGAAIFLVAETICRAERRSGRIATLLQLFYLPLASPLLYGRLEALQRR